MAEQNIPTLLLVGNFLSVTGGSRGVCEDLALRIGSAGWARVITTSNRPGPLGKLIDMLGTAWRRRREYSAAQVEVYSGRAFVWAEAVVAVLRMARKPFVLTLHGGNLPAFAARWPRRVRRLLSSAPVVTTPSRYLQEQLREYRPDLRLLPNAIDLAGCEFRRREKVQPRLAWLRGFHALYNPQMALQVMAGLVPDFPDVQLTMVGPDRGDGSLQAFEETAVRLGLRERVHMPGSVAKAEVPRWLGHGDIFLNTTNFDNTPVSVLEAAACGLCVVSTNVGGIPYLFEHERDALLVPKADDRAMTAAVCRLLNEPALAGRLSQNGRTKAEQCDWSVVLPQWRALFGPWLATPVSA